MVRYEDLARLVARSRTRPCVLSRLTIQAIQAGEPQQKGRHAHTPLRRQRPLFIAPVRAGLSLVKRRTRQADRQTPAYPADQRLRSGHVVSQRGRR
jgi:hypothetical protein